MMQQAIFRPQPALMTARPAFRQPPPPPGAQFGQLQGSSGPRPLSLEEVLSQRGFEMPEKPRVSSQDVAFLGTDPVTGRMRRGGSTLRPYYRKLDELYAQNPEALEIAKQYTADPTQFGGEPSRPRSLDGGIISGIQRPGGSMNQVVDMESETQRRQQQPDYSQQIREMQSMMREMMQMISALSGRGGGFYSPRQRTMFGGIGSLPLAGGFYF
jgi:hypothetical protein